MHHASYLYLYLYLYANNNRKNWQDGNKELSETLYKMLLAANAAPSLSAANAAIKGSATIDKALVRRFGGFTRQSGFV